MLRVSGPSRLNKLAVAVCSCGALILSLNLLTLDLRRIGNRYVAFGEQSLGLGEVATAYLATVGMGLGGYLVGAPYAAMENLRLLTPNSGNIELVDDFPATSKKVQRAVAKSKLQDSNTTHYPLVWQSYCEDSCDAGFALNGGTLTVRVAGESCTASAKVHVSYKPQYRRSTILSSTLVKLEVDQAALHALQRLGYLHPYQLTYRWNC